MGVDFYCCSSCKQSRYEEYVESCTGCGKRLCTSCLVNDDVNSRFAHHYGVKFDSNNKELVDELISYGMETDEDGKITGYHEGELIDDSAIDPKYCPYCQDKEVDNDAVLKYLLEKYNLTAKKVWKEMKKLNK
jgi:hypothetical protein